MCKPASLVITKQYKCFWSRFSDSHENIIKEHGLSEGSRASVGDANFVRVEITPPYGDMKKPLKDWLYHLDENNPPSWYDAKNAEAVAREGLKEWFAAKVIIDAKPEDVRELKDGEWYIFNSSVEAWGSSSVEAWGSSSVVA